MEAFAQAHGHGVERRWTEYIFGHSCQPIAVVVHAATSFLAVPLASVIHEGVVFSNRGKRALLDKLVLLLASLAITTRFYLVADRYYASAKVILPPLNRGQHLITAAKPSCPAATSHAKNSACEAPPTTGSTTRSAAPSSSSPKPSPKASPPPR